MERRPRRSVRTAVARQKEKAQGEGVLGRDLEGYTVQRERWTTVGLGDWKTESGGWRGWRGIVEEEEEEGKGNGFRDKGIEGCRDRESQFSGANPRPPMPFIIRARSILTRTRCTGLHVGCFDGCYHFGSEKAHWQTWLLEWNRWNRTEDHHAFDSMKPTLQELFSPLIRYRRLISHSLNSTLDPGAEEGRKPMMKRWADVVKGVIAEETMKALEPAPRILILDPNAGYAARLDSHREQKIDTLAAPVIHGLIRETTK
ncbi:hypothetical protein C8R42DRAFT_647384 [Lentinula raphanica]|nr:hypothetical protein C8R42DRAFT_647384 [Lentinula raphanica]